MESLMFSDIEERFADFCKDCPLSELYVGAANTFDEHGNVTGRKRLISCENLDKCTRLYQYLKERQNG